MVSFSSWHVGWAVTTETFTLSLQEERGVFTSEGLHCCDIITYKYALSLLTGLTLDPSRQLSFVKLTASRSKPTTTSLPQGSSPLRSPLRYGTGPIPHQPSHRYPVPTTYRGRTPYPRLRRLPPHARTSADRRVFRSHTGHTDRYPTLVRSEPGTQLAVPRLPASWRQPYPRGHLAQALEENPTTTSSPLSWASWPSTTPVLARPTTRSKTKLSTTPRSRH